MYVIIHVTFVFKPRSVMNKVKNIYELSQHSQEKLNDILGSTGNAKTLWEFFHDSHKLDLNKR